MSQIASGLYDCSAVYTAALESAKYYTPCVSDRDLSHTLARTCELFDAGSISLNVSLLKNGVSPNFFVINS
jgi:hypothetical protein